MNNNTVFLLGVALTLIAAFLVVGYLRPHLMRLLVELCGTQERANFWGAFSNLTIVLVPVIFALHFRPESDQAVSFILQMSNQLEGALIGLVASVLILGFVMGKFIAGVPRPSLAGEQLQGAAPKNTAA